MNIKPEFLLLVLIAASIHAEVIVLPDDTRVSKQPDSEGIPHYSTSGFAETPKKSTGKENPSVERATTAYKIIKTAPRIDIYYANWDPHSQQALIFFRENHLVVTNAYDIEQDPEAAARKKKLAPDYNGMPLVIINGVIIRGIDVDLYAKALQKTPVAEDMPPPK